MSSACVTASAGANRRGAETCTRFDHCGDVNNMVAGCLRKIFPIKTWAKIADLFGLSERTAKHRLAGTREFSVGELATLLRSEHGFEFLCDVMADAKPKWWKLCVPLMEVAEVQRMQSAARKRLRRAVEGALDADADLTAAISRAEAFQDADFHRPSIDGLRAAGRIPHRAMAPAPKGPLNSKR